LADTQSQVGFAGLRTLAACGGCAAKADPGLVTLLTSLIAAATPDRPEVLAGLAPWDDAAVYQLDAERSLVATVDFFPPLVDDPEDYGAIAAANAVSDVYAMGGEVAFALVLSGFPSQVPQQVIAAATTAAAGVVSGCGGQVLGGHSIRCAEPVFGLCVLGFAHPDRIWRKSGARPGDVLVLSKPLGTGVLLSQHTQEGVAAAVASMRRTNRDAAATLGAALPNAVTDITGYGLLGHAFEVAQSSRVSLEICAGNVPLLPGALGAAASGARTSAHDSNCAAIANALTIAPRVSQAHRALLCDPQTSGGLLAAVHPDRATALVERGFLVIGSVASGPPRISVV
jgi:selenide,water dikinase